MEIAIILICLIPIPYLLLILYNTNKGTGAQGNQGTPKSQNVLELLHLSII